MKRTVIALALCAAIAVPALAQSYDPDLGPAGNVRSAPFAFGYPGYDHWRRHYGYSARQRGYYGRWRHDAWGAYARVGAGGCYGRFCRSRY